MRLERSELHALLAVIEHGGFKRAAESLSVTQSAVSQAVANLEGKAGTILIKRGKVPSLTAAGRRVYDHALDVVRGEEQVLADLVYIRSGSVAPLSVACNGLVNSLYMPRLLRAFCVHNPAARVHAQELPSRSIIYSVLSGDCELGFGPFQKNMSAFTTVPLFSETRHLVVARSHPHWAALVAGDDKALRQSVLITSWLDDPAQRPSSQRIRDNFASVWQVSSMQLRIGLVQQGLGVTFISSKLLEAEAGFEHLQPLQRLAYGSIQREVGIYYQRGKLLSATAQMFVEQCRGFWPAVAVPGK